MTVHAPHALVTFCLCGALLQLPGHAHGALPQDSPAQTQAWGDFDGDGLADLYVINPLGEDRLFRNSGDGTFEDVTQQAGVGGNVGSRQGLWNDFDQDQHPDLLLVTARGGLRLYRGLGDGLLGEGGKSLGVAAEGGILAAEWVDYDLDGWVDIRLETESGIPIFFHCLGGRAFEEIELNLPDLGPRVGTDLSGSGPLGSQTEGEVPDGARRSTRGNARTEPPSPVVVPGTGSGGNRGAAGPAPGTSGSLGPPGPGAEVVCTLGVWDMAFPGTCIGASSIPAPGALYPLGPEFFIDAATGYVGIGTMTPLQRLHVGGGLLVDFDIETNGQLVSMATSGAPLAVSSSELVSGLNADLLDGAHASAFSQLGNSIDGAEITDLTIEEMDLAPGAVTTPKLAPAAVTENELAPGAVTSAHLVPLSVGTGHLAAGAVDASKIAPDSIDDSHILPTAAIAGTKVDADFGVQPVRTSGQLVSTATSGAPLAVSSSELVSGLNADLLDGMEASAFSQLGDSIEGAEITDGTITDADLGAGSVTSSKVAAGSVSNVHVSPAAAIAGTKIDANFGVQHVRTGAQLVSTATSGAPLAVSSSELVSGLNADLLDGAHASAFSQLGNSIEGAEITDGTITTADLGGGAVTASKVAAGSMSDVHVSPAAAIAGTKIDADFGAQPVRTSDQLISTATTGAPLAVSSSALVSGLNADLLDGLDASAFGLTPEQEEILSHMSIVFLDDAQGGTVKTLRISDINLQIVNGLGATNGYPQDPYTVDSGLTVTNGLGNLIVGYNEWSTDILPDDRTGSHNFVVGHGNNFPSFGGLVAGRRNFSNAPFATVSGGNANWAFGTDSSISGGKYNVASGRYSSISGGDFNSAGGDWSSVSGGTSNRAKGDWSSVSGGSFNDAYGDYSSVSGGKDNTTYGSNSSVSGGKDNTTYGTYSSISGGSDNTTTVGGTSSSISGGWSNETTVSNTSVSGGIYNTAGKYGAGVGSSISGGQDNTTYGRYSSISGGRGNWTGNPFQTGSWSSVSGGQGNTTQGRYSSVSGGRENEATGDWSSVSGGYDNTASGDYSSVSGGEDGTAYGRFSSVGGGDHGTASGNHSSVSGGYWNTADGYRSSVSGGGGNFASGDRSSVSGGASRSVSGTSDWRGGKYFSDN